MTPAAPTTEIGRAGQTFNLPGWDKFSAAVDELEYAPGLMWPTSVLSTYPRMETDAQLTGLLLGTMLPIRRYRWSIDPNGARDEVVEHVARNFNLPITGETAPPPVPRSEARNRFSHDRHLAHALRALVYGHYPFEQVGSLDANDRWVLRKLAPRPPRTIANGGTIEVDPHDGGLAGIKQGVGMQAKLIPVSRLVYYCWDQEGANWFGRSMIRSCYRHWARKDRLLRVDAMKHERNSMGVPWFETDDKLTKPQVDALARTAQRMRSGDQSGGAGPGKLQIKGVDGQLPDIIESIRYDDQQMSMAMLMLFVDLGRNSETGSRSLGDSFIDWYGYAQEAIADWYANVTIEHAIWDDVDWSFGQDENSPKLVYDRSAEEDLPTADLATLVSEGVISVDPELENAIRRKFSLPERPETEAPAGQSFGYDLDNAILTIDERRAQVGLEPRQDGRGALTVPEFLAEYGGSEEGAIQGTNGPGQTSARSKQSRAPKAAATVPDRQLHREPFPHEVQAAVDYDAMEQVYGTERDALVAAVKALQAEQVAELREQILAAGGDLDALVNLAATPLAGDVIADSMRRTMAAGIEQAEAEAVAQGVTPSAVDTDALEPDLVARANATSASLARALSEAASRKALQVTGGTLTVGEVADQVSEHLDSLSDAFLEEQLGGSIIRGQNTGRNAVFRENEPDRLYGSALLDTNTCDACAQWDGEDFETVEDLEAQFPAGNKDCYGGPRCRCTGVAVYEG
jgi:hypothetical protein